MGAPQLSPEKEGARSAVVDELSRNALRNDGALERVADAAAAICGVPKAHVSLMETERQCVVGHVGFEMSSFDRDKTFCAYTIAKGDVVIVEDASEDDRFEGNPFVTGDPGVSFYVGLPLMVDEVPVGTLCAIDTEPKELQLDRRSELFGLVNAVERHLKVVYRHGNRTPEHGVSSKLTAIRALSCRERFRNSDKSALCDALRELEAETLEAFEMLTEMPTTNEVRLGMASTDLVDEESVA